MAKNSRRPARPSGKGRGHTASPRRPRPAAAKRASEPVVFDAPRAQPEEPRTFRLGVVPGSTPGKWIDAWKDRLPQVPIELVRIEVAAQRTALADVDAAIVRLPLDDDDLHVITLYEEVPVVVVSVDSHLLAADELRLSDLAGELVLPLSDDALGGLDVPGALRPPTGPLRTQDAIATVAAGAGAVIVPMSLARLHHRKDTEHRPLLDGPSSTVALAWLRERTTPDVETFVGIVRGRTANSSR